MNLKTLKDFEVENTICMHDLGLDTIGNEDLIRNLRQEAIKWIKELNKERETSKYIHEMESSGFEGYGEKMGFNEVTIHCKPNEVFAVWKENMIGEPNEDYIDMTDPTKQISRMEILEKSTKVKFFPHKHLEDKE